MAYKKSEDRKKQILDCAKRLFAQKGFQAAQIADICDELHIARGTVYQYFDNKEDIFGTLIKEYFRNMTNALLDMPVQDAIIRGERLDVGQLKIMLNDYTHAFFMHMYKDRDIGHIIFREGFTTMPEIGDMLRSFFDERKRMLVASLTAGMALGVNRPLNAELIATAMMGTTTRVVLDFILEGRVRDESELRPMAEELVNFQLHGILAPGA